MKSFASDNYASAHQDILKAIEEANTGHAQAYGSDPWTEKLNEKVRSVFGNEASAFPVFNGTGANVVGLKSLLKSYEAVLCTDVSHINVDECGAGEKFLGSKLIDIKSSNGKIAPQNIEPYTKNYGNEHQVQAKVLSLTQSTERGTTYKLAELTALGDFAQKKGIRVTMDGARFSNAVVSLKAKPSDILKAAKVEVLSFGGTKNGLVIGELLVVLNPEIASEMKYLRKQAMQLSSKMRFISAQFLAYLNNDLWLKNATHSNEMAKYLEQKLQNYSEIKITESVEANVVFVKTPREIVAPLKKEYPFYTWNEEICEHRWMCSFDTTKEDVDDFVKRLETLL